MVCTFLGYISHKSVWSEIFIATRFWLMAIKSNPKIQTTHTYPDFKGHFYSLGTVLYVRFKTYSTGWRNSPTRFSTFSFFHNSNLSGPLSKGLKYFWFWLRFRWVIRIFRKNFHGVSYCAESISPGYATPGSHSWPRESTAISLHSCISL